MNKNRLPREQELSLLGKLSSDDAFRTRYETDPRAALKELGVTDSTLASLDPAGLAPGKLADKSVIAQTLKPLTEQGLSDHVCLIFPVLRLNYGDPGSDKTP
mgnify:FL=1